MAMTAIARAFRTSRVGTTMFSTRSMHTDNNSTNSWMQLARRLQQEKAEAGSNFVFSPLSFRAALSDAAATLVDRPRLLKQYLPFLGATNLAGLNSAANRLSHASRPFDDNGFCLRSSIKSAHQIPVYNPLSTWWNRNPPTLKPDAGKIARETINSYVDQETLGMIKEIIPRSQERRRVMHSFYFKDMWPFESTHLLCSYYKKKNSLLFHDSSTFMPVDGNTVQVPFMTSSDRHYLRSFDGFNVLYLPHRGSRESTRLFSTLLFLPHEKAGVDSLAGKVLSDPSFIENHIPDKRVYVDDLRIPQFKVSTSFDASELMKEMGIDTSHTKIQHAASIEVDTRGTKAAAATAWYEECCSMGGSGLSTDTFAGDHPFEPFLFAIREDRSGEIFAVGHVVNPFSLTN